METLRIYTRLIRLGQWYKNLVIFLPLLFAPNVRPLTALVIGFLGFACVSSMTYIVNDWMDREKDRIHPVKKNRPLASGKVTGRQALLVSFLLALVVVGAVYLLGLFYGAIILAYFVLTNLYSFGLKNIPLVDILIIASNFAMRMMAGLEEFPDITTGPYFGLLIGIIVIFLTHKRSNDIKMLGEKAVKHKPVLRYYTWKKNYIYRALAYAIVIFSFFIMWQNGLDFYLEAGLYLQLFVTSVILSLNPEYTSNPQHLFRSKIWTLILIGNIIQFTVFFL